MNSKLNNQDWFVEELTRNMWNVNLRKVYCHLFNNSTMDLSIITQLILRIYSCIRPSDGHLTSKKMIILRKRDNSSWKWKNSVWNDSLKQKMKLNWSIVFSFKPLKTQDSIITMIISVSLPMYASSMGESTSWSIIETPNQNYLWFQFSEQEKKEIL